MKIEPTSTECLVRHGDPGIYYARTKIKGRIYLRSIETKAAKTAKLRLPEKLKAIREQAPAETASALEPKATLPEIAALYTQ